MTDDYVNQFRKNVIRIMGERIDVSVYEAGLKQLKNFIPMPSHLTRRPVNVVTEIHGGGLYIITPSGVSRVGTRST